MTSREAKDAASTRPIFAIEGLSSARAKVPTDREIEIRLKQKIIKLLKKIRTVQSAPDSCDLAPTFVLLDPLQTRDPWLDRLEPREFSPLDTHHQLEYRPYRPVTFFATL